MHKFQFELAPAKDLDPNGSLFYLTIILTHCATQKMEKIITVVVENLEQLDWFTENEKAIRYNKCPVSIETNTSVAETISLTYETIDPDEEDKLLEELYNFRSIHALRFAFRGQDLPDIMISATQHGHEISCHDSDNQFRLNIDIDSLFIEVEKIKQVYQQLNANDLNP